MRLSVVINDIAVDTFIIAKKSTHVQFIMFLENKLILACAD